MSLITFILTGFIVGIIAKALVAGRDPGTGIVLLVGTAAQIVSWLLLGAIGLRGYGQLWSFLASIGVAAVMLSLYNDATERPGCRRTSHDRIVSSKWSRHYGHLRRVPSANARWTRADLP